MKLQPKSVLWFDDEWGTARQAGLAPWLRALHAEERGHYMKLTMCNSLREFARLLHEGPEPGRVFDLLIIDLMLTDELETTYACMGFPNERVLRLDAGAQIAGLLRSSAFDDERASWLAAYQHVPILLLSNSPTLHALVINYVGHKRMDQIKVLSKEFVVRKGGDGVDAQPNFVEAVRLLLNVAR